MRELPLLVFFFLIPLLCIQSTNAYNTVVLSSCGLTANVSSTAYILTADITSYSETAPCFKSGDYKSDIILDCKGFAFKCEDPYCSPFHLSLTYAHDWLITNCVFEYLFFFPRIVFCFLTKKCFLKERNSIYIYYYPLFIFSFYF